MAPRQAVTLVIDVLRIEKSLLIWGGGHDHHQHQERLDRRTDIGFLDTRQDEGAVFMAYGDAHASGRPAIWPPSCRR